jgi:hypothetical protein
LSPELLASLDARTQGYLPPQALPVQRQITLAVAGEVRTYNVVDPTTATGERTRVIGALYAARRQPTADEVKRINDSLTAMEKGVDASAAAPVSMPGPKVKPSPSPKAEAQDAANASG